MSKYIQINPADNVSVALAPIKAGSKIDLKGGFVLKDDIPAGHKFAVVDIPNSGNVIKYGFQIGHVTQEVAKGCHIDHNILKTNLEGRTRQAKRDARPERQGIGGKRQSVGGVNLPRHRPRTNCRKSENFGKDGEGFVGG